MADTARVLEIAAGTGALGIAVTRALARIGIGADVVCGIERESTAAAAFVARVENETGRRPAVWDDARTCVARRYRCPGPGSGIDIICGGYPCQPFSLAGRRAGTQDGRHLWPACRRIVARLQPGVVLFENVSGHVSMGLAKVCKDLARLGYRTAAGLFTAEEVGAPHLRERVFVLGVRDGERDGFITADAPDERRETVRSPAGARSKLCELPDAASARLAETGGGADVREQQCGQRVSTSAGSELGDGQRTHARPGEPIEQGEARIGRRGFADDDEELGDEQGDGREQRRAEPEGNVGRHDSAEPDGQLGDELRSRLHGRESALCRPPGDSGPIAECGGTLDFERWRAGGPRPVFPPPRRIDLAEVAKNLAKVGPLGPRASLVDAACRGARRMYRDWEIVAEMDPTLMPAIESGVPVVADGMASSADLLRLGGNGVVTDTAEYALLTLLASMDPDDAPLFKEQT